jgi:lipoprotein-anchoring transpeptidase ErfK/SrfK
MRSALVLAVINAASVLFPTMAHAGFGFFDAGVPGGNRGAVVVSIDKTNQQMSVFVNGVETYRWRVSTGRAGYSTPSGTYTATSMNEIWHSKEFDNAPMPHAVFFMRDGHAIHGSFDVKNLGKPVSHGCVRISPENAATLFELVRQYGLENTRVVLSGVSPGGEYKIAGSQASPRGGSSARATSVRNYNNGPQDYYGSQGYYGSPRTSSPW